MPTATPKKPVTRRRTVAKKPTVQSVPAPVPTVDEPVAQREFWVLRIAPQWKDFSGPEYFYDGEIRVEKGIARIPVQRTDWVQRLLFSNYSFTSGQDERDFNATIR